MDYQHSAYYVPIVSETISNAGQVVYHTTHHIRTPGYKQDYADGASGWAVEKGFVPKPLGGAFVRMTVTDNGIRQNKPRRMACDIQVQPVIHAPEVA